MKLVFVDTSALIAIGNKRDFYHRQALDVRANLKTRKTNFVTTNAVLLEFGNAFSPVHLRSTAIQIIEAIRYSIKWNCINVEESLVQRGVEFYKQMNDKEWGLVDCISMIAAKDLEITEIFSADHHFEQAGFELLLKTAPSP